ncbi:MAG: glutathione S-transferase family protein [Piscirickettsiaceae bacterium]|jgi:glutathione S-transferase|nr:glutathione S-transferase family protein [Piscirickettsiaceae bacterium]
MFGLFKKKKKAEAGMKLLGFPGDLSTVKCLVMAAEKQIKLETELLDTQAGEHDQAEYRGLSPFGKHPYLEEGDAVAIGAEASLAYMDTRGKGFLNPKKAQNFGHQNYWWQVSETIGAPVESLLNAAAFGSTADADAVALVETGLNAFDAALTGKNLIVGDYSYADVHWTAVAHFLVLAGKQDMIESRPNIKAWYDKIKQRPSYASLPSLEDIKQKQLNAA